ncbi:MAG TPA: LuxR C-terminal-related transcriptional regulator [Ktedonobacterales bacterium]|nr:LuxR C-terminal-related transcriptional regulator [Ktedonobacterales bacterium]
MIADTSAPRSNLPAHVSSFIGRQDELAEIARLLGERRLITLTGPGGTGKTRLALRAAANEVDHFPDGVWLVELAPLAGPELVVETIAKVLRTPKAGEQDPLEHLGALLALRRLLVVLDNCEHLLDECARVTAYLLMNCPSLVVLATSREPLGIGGEWVLRVPPLGLPEPTDPLDIERLLEHDAIRLFVERARAAEPSFRLTSVTAPAVVEICRTLDGIPLALELAAMRVRGMGVAHLGARLDDRFRLLTSGDRAGEPRQRTLYAAVDWSYGLLPERERVVMRRLGVFIGNFSLKAAEAVCVDVDTDADAHGQAPITAEGMLDDLTRLVDKSLAQFDQDTALYRLLETIRRYCLERQAEAGETNYVNRQRFAYYLQLAENGVAHIGGPGEEAWFAQIEQEHDNFRGALAWAIQAGRTDEAARLALGVWKFWHTRIYQREGLRWLQQILALDATRPLPDSLRPSFFNALGVLAHSSGRFEESIAYHTEAQRLWTIAGDEAGMAQACVDIAWLYFDRARLDEALPYAEEGLARAERVGDERLLAGALMARDAVAVQSGRLEGVIPDLERILAIWRKLGDLDSQASTLAFMGATYQQSGEYERSKPFIAESLRLHVRLGAYGELISSFVGLHFLSASMAETREQALDAARVIGVMKAWEQYMYAMSSPWWESDAEKVLRSTIIEKIGREGMERGIAEGQRMTTAEIVALCERLTAPSQPTGASTSSTSSAPPAPPAPPAPRETPEAPQAGLTRREVEVLRLVAKGLTNAQVAQALVITPRTVNAHLTAIYAKIGVTSRSGAIRYALEHQLD